MTSLLAIQAISSGMSWANFLSNKLRIYSKIECFVEIHFLCATIFGAIHIPLGNLERRLGPDVLAACLSAVQPAQKA
jgi:hypothetical protein